MSNELKIIQPAHNKPASKVKNWDEIKADATELRRIIRKGGFSGHYDDAFAISHAQVSNKPMNFFVINEDTNKGVIRKVFGSWCIINLKMIKFGKPVSVKEGCMSWPFRKPKKVNRMAEIKAKYKVPFWFGTLISKTKTLTDLPAFIAQHETEHAAGQNIYGKK